MASGMLGTQTPSRLPLRQKVYGILAIFVVKRHLQWWTIPLGIALKGRDIMKRDQFHQTASTILTGQMPSTLPSHLSDKSMATRIQPKGKFRLPLSAPNKSRKETFRLVRSTTAYTMTWWEKPSRSWTCKFMSTSGIHAIKDSQLTRMNINIRSTWWVKRSSLMLRGRFSTMSTTKTTLISTSIWAASTIQMPSQSRNRRYSIWLS